MERKSSNVGRISALAYTLISVSVALTFFLVASSLGGYTRTAIVGGTAWVFLLTMIVTMPTVTPWVKRRLGG
ncbi:MAG: hypothetical protein ACYC3S_10165 [Chloroflexota bacterium]